MWHKLGPLGALHSHADIADGDFARCRCILINKVAQAAQTNHSNSSSATSTADTTATTVDACY